MIKHNEKIYDKTLITASNAYPHPYFVMDALVSEQN